MHSRRKRETFSKYSFKKKTSTHIFTKYRIFTYETVENAISQIKRTPLIKNSHMTVFAPIESQPDRQIALLIRKRLKNQTKFRRANYRRTITSSDHTIPQLEGPLMQLLRYIQVQSKYPRPWGPSCCLYANEAGHHGRIWFSTPSHIMEPAPGARFHTICIYMYVYMYIFGGVCVFSWKPPSAFGCLTFSLSDEGARCWCFWECSFKLWVFSGWNF